ncbi:uncharacterized protein LOC116344716 [Contarinia nasturtii]|uniref:uncharacterized protein LOC116344716 n=1 Tax=Contarinia nasturtii TaxID=265458 RepID=UPI0012D3855B|nr:uncharacterized protein LOC116344716 [Contarinia nasturtii]
MFRAICKRILAKNNAITSLRNGYGTEHMPTSMPTIKSEMNIVRMSGSIEDTIVRLPNGAINLYLKTLNENASYSIHKVVIANPNLLKIVKNILKADQRIHIGGRLRSITERIDSRSKRSCEIMANEIFMLEPMPKLTEQTINNLTGINRIDQNSVEMMAFIGSEPNIWENSCRFDLRTHFIQRKGTPDEVVSNEYHSVYMDNKDPNLLKLGKQLGKSDRVYLNGYIDYIDRKFPDENDHTIGFIRPTNLVRFKKIKNVYQAEHVVQ